LKTGVISHQISKTNLLNIRGFLTEVKTEAQEARLAAAKQPYRYCNTQAATALRAIPA